MIELLHDNRVFINHGPTQMVIDAYIHNQRATQIGLEAGQLVVDQLELLAAYYPDLKKMRTYREERDEFPDVLNRMIRAVNKSGYDELNTLGAVAGSFSDLARGKAISLGATRVIVNNGGDISMKDILNNPIRVGIPLKNNNGNQELVLTITYDMNVGGICASGFGGRSFTKGIATFAVCLAEDSAIADACATYLGNVTNVEDENIIRCFAEEIDSGTDIAGQLVTLKVGDISRAKQLKALYNGIEAAEDLYKKDIIKGAILCVNDNIVKYPDDLKVDFIKNPV